ncbi:MAG: cation:proton antiporter [Alphaproteobacteria bacterium]
MDLGSAFYEIAALLALASVAGLAAVLLRQPLIVAFIIVGLLAGPSLLGITRSLEYVDLLADIGIALLLFLVGLKLDLELVRTLGRVALATGLGQVAFTSIVGFFICLALGLTPVEAAYVAVALTFSSTIIIVKLLSDKREIDALHGRIALGFLIVQDIAVVVAMLALSAIGVGAAADNAGREILTTLASAAAAIFGIALFMRFAAERLLALLARVPELLTTFAIAWAVLLAALGDWSGIGMELGGLLGGVSLASTSYREAVAARLSSLRDFLLLFFFIGLGTRLDLSVLGAQIEASIILSLFVLIGNPLIVLLIMGWMGYRKRTGFLAGLTVAQISEFSLIFMAMGVSLGHVGPEMMALVTLVGLVTIGTSTYMIVYSQRLYSLLEPLLWPFERRVAHRESADDKPDDSRPHEVILFGLGRYGLQIARGLRNADITVLGVDFNPEAVQAAQAEGFAAVYGDAADPEFPATLPLNRAKWVVTGIPPREVGPTHLDPRAALVRALRDSGFRGRIAVTSDRPDLTDRLQAEGADLVLSPLADAADRGVERIAAARPGRG